MEHRMNDFAWSIDERKDPEITLACDESLDEGNAIIRASFAPGIGSSGTEYFVQIDRPRANALLMALDIAEDGAPDDVADELAALRDLARRVLGYIAPTTSALVELPSDTAEPRQEMVEPGWWIVADPTGRESMDAMEVGYVAEIGRDHRGVPVALVQFNGSSARVAIVTAQEILLRG